MWVWNRMRTENGRERQNTLWGEAVLTRGFRRVFTFKFYLEGLKGVYYYCIIYWQA